MALAAGPSTAILPAGLALAIGHAGAIAVVANILLPAGPTHPSAAVVAAGLAFTIREAWRAVHRAVSCRLKLIAHAVPTREPAIGRADSGILLQPADPVAAPTAVHGATEGTLARTTFPVAAGFQAVLGAGLLGLDWPGAQSVAAAGAVLGAGLSPLAGSVAALRAAIAEAHLQGFVLRRQPGFARLTPTVSTNRWAVLNAAGSRDILPRFTQQVATARTVHRAGGHLLVFAGPVPTHWSAIKVAIGGFVLPLPTLRKGAHPVATEQPAAIEGALLHGGALAIAAAQGIGRQTEALARDTTVPRGAGIGVSASLAILGNRLYTP